MSNPSSNSSDWNSLLVHSSALGILKPGVVFNGYNTTPHTSSSSSMGGSLQQPRVVRTSHDDHGASVFASDEALAPFSPFGPAGSAFAVVDVRSSIPVDNRQVGLELSQTVPRCPPGGVLFVITDIPGNGYSAPMHRTASLDYTVVLAGEIVLELDSGETRTVRAGEVVVQQGTNHRWINKGAGPCRIMFAMVGAEKVVLSDGKVLEETVF